MGSREPGSLVNAVRSQVDLGICTPAFTGHKGWSGRRLVMSESWNGQNLRRVRGERDAEMIGPVSTLARWPRGTRAVWTSGASRLGLTSNWRTAGDRRQEMADGVVMVMLVVRAGERLESDILVGSSARFTLAHTAIGFSPDGGSSLLTASVGLHRATHLALLNPVLAADEALAIGL